MDLFLLCFIPLFVAMDPPGILPVFFRLTAGHNAAQRKRLVLQAIPTAALIGLVFFGLGRPILNFLHIQVFDLQIAGGVLLFLYALMDLVVPGKPAVAGTANTANSAGASNGTTVTASPDHSSGIVPLATPIIVGPAVMTLGLVMVDKHGYMLASAALIANILILLAILLSADMILRVVPLTAMNAASKVVDLLLAAIGVMLVREGVVGIIEHVKNSPPI